MQVDHTYRNYLQVHNGGRVAMKINVVNKPDICDYFEFSPNFGFAQVGWGCTSGQEFQEDLLNQLPQR